MSEIGFLANGNKKNNLAPIVNINFTNAICYGITGSGKTTSFMLPNIDNRMKLNHGLLIYDFKGTLHNHIKILADKHDKLNDVIEIGKPWGKKINLLDYIDIKKFKHLYETLHGSSSDSYWLNASSNLFENIYLGSKYCYMLNKITIDIFTKFPELESEMLPSIYKNDNLKYTTLPTFKLLYTHISDIASLKSFLGHIHIRYLQIRSIIFTLLDYSSNNIPLEKDTAKLIDYNEKLLNCYKALKPYQKLSENSTEDHGNYGVVSSLSTAINSISNNEYINTKDDEFDIYNSLQDGKIIIVNTSAIDEKVITSLNMAIHNKLLKNVKKINL